MDNLIAAGKAVPMIIVMDCGDLKTNSYFKKPGQGNRGGNINDIFTQDERTLLTIAESELNLPGFLQHFFAGSSSEFSGNAEYTSSSGRDSENAGGRSRFADDVIADGMTLDQCYATLGCTKDASNEELKRCWRAKAKEFHPDKVIGKGLSASFIEQAKMRCIFGKMSLLASSRQASRPWLKLVQS